MSLPTTWPQSPKVPATKVALGSFHGRRTIRSSLDPDDGRLPDGSPFEHHSIVLAKGQRARFVLDSQEFDPYLLIVRRLDGRSEVLAEDDDSGGAHKARIDFTPPEPGEYLVLATTAVTEGRGNYTLGVEVSGRPAARIPAIRDGTRVGGIGQDVRGELSTKDPRLEDGSPFHAIEFDVGDGTPIDLRLMSTRFDAVLALARVTDAGYEPIAQNDDDERGGTTDSRITGRIAKGGRLAAIVTTYDPQGSGDYELAIRVAPQSIEDWARRYPGGGSRDGRYALVVGIDDYPGAEDDLGTCVNDTRLFADLLATRFGFDRKDIVTIHDREATREHLIAAIRGHLGQAGPNGVAVFYFSGHGMQLDENVMLQGDEDPEEDDRDESIVVWSDLGGGAMLIDDEIGQLLGELWAGSLLVVLDTCHSGTGSRGGGTGIPEKWIANNDRTRALYPTPAAFVDTTGSRRGTVKGDDPGNHILLAATAPDQTALAPDVPWASTGCLASLFTHYLVERMRAADSATTWSQIIEQVKQDTAAYEAGPGSAARKDGSRQDPQAEGVRVDEPLDRYLRFRQ